MIELRCLLRRFRKEDSGNVIIIVAIMLVVLIGFTALVIDVGQLYATRRQMVSAADGAALAGSLEKFPQHLDRARQVAKDYAENNGAVGFNKDEDVVFVHPDGDNPTMHVKACRPVEFTFARVLGFEDTEVCAVASVQRGPGNPLVPFVDIAHLCCGITPCECEGEVCECEPCECEGEICECEPCECESENTCKCEDEDGVPLDGCLCEEECICCRGGVEYNDERYFVWNDQGECAQPGDVIQLKYERHQDTWPGFAPGNFPYVRLPGRSGVDLRHDIGGGYTGDLSSVSPGEVIRDEPGHSLGNLVKGLEERLTFAGDNPCNTYEQVKDDPYSCPLVVIVPLVHTQLQEVEQQGGSTLGNRQMRIVGFASFLLILVGEEYEDEDDKEVYAILIEYLDWDRMNEVLPAQLEGFVLKLVKTEGNPFGEEVSP